MKWILKSFFFWFLEHWYFLFNTIINYYNKISYFIMWIVDDKSTKISNSKRVRRIKKIELIKDIFFIISSFFFILFLIINILDGKISIFYLIINIFNWFFFFHVLFYLRWKIRHEEPEKFNKTHDSIYNNCIRLINVMVFFAWFSFLVDYLWPFNLIISSNIDTYNLQINLFEDYMYFLFELMIKLISITSIILILIIIYAVYWRFLKLRSTHKEGVTIHNFSVLVLIINFIFWVIYIILLSFYYILYKLFVYSIVLLFLFFELDFFELSSIIYNSNLKIIFIYDIENYKIKYLFEIWDNNLILPFISDVNNSNSPEILFSDIIGSGEFNENDTVQFLKKFNFYSNLDCSYFSLNNSELSYIKNNSFTRNDIITNATKLFLEKKKELFIKIINLDVYEINSTNSYCSTIYNSLYSFFYRNRNTIMKILSFGVIVSYFYDVELVFDLIEEESQEDWWPNGYPDL